MQYSTTVLVTGSDGFIGRNLKVALSRLPDVRTLCFDLGDDQETLEAHLMEADLVFHLAGVNRPQHVEEFAAGNAGLTERIVDLLMKLGRSSAVLISSSIQAALDNPYGASKKSAEESLFAYAVSTGAPVYVYRLHNVFGKWSRPNYNSVVSTFCHNICHGLDITISNPANEVELVYIDDVVAEFLAVLDGQRAPSTGYLSVTPSYRLTLSQLADRIYGFRDLRTTLEMPDMSDGLTLKLYATYLSYLDPADFSAPLELKTDNRGDLAELIKSRPFGQMFVSRTYGGIIRGNHYHDTKIEKFCILQGEAVVRFRHILTEEVVEYRVSGRKWEVVDIPPGYTHHVENLSEREMILLVWANQIFDPLQPDTTYCEVKREQD